MGDRSYSFDANMVLADGATAMTASGWAQVGGATGILDLGGNQLSGAPMPAARIDAMCVIMVAAITTSGSSLYRLTLAGSNDPAFGAGNVQNLASMDFGNATVRDGLNALTTAAPGGSTAYPADCMYEMPFTNEQNSVKYQFLQLYVGAVVGSIQFSAYVAVLPEP